jgi:acyl-CoA thioesterase-1
LRILAFGDSLVHGYGLDAEDTFPAQLQRELDRAGYRAEVLNGGNSGDTTAAGLARLDWALSDKPDLAIVVLGANDGLRGIDPEETYRNLDAILSRLAAADLPVLLAGMLAPRNLGSDYAEAFDAVFPRLAELHDVAFYPFFLDGVAMQPRLNQADGIHPNAAGVARVVEGILPSVVRLIESRDETPASETGDG